MRVSFDGELFRATHISGPTHNYLGLVLTEEDGPTGVAVTVLPPVSKCCRGNRLSTFDVGSWIAQGIEAGNRQAGTHFRVTYVEVVENDHPLPEVYAALTRRIVLAAHEKAGPR